MDATFFDRQTASRHYCRRTNYRVQTLMRHRRPTRPVSSGDSTSSRTFFSVIPTKWLHDMLVHPNQPGTLAQRLERRWVDGLRPSFAGGLPAKLSPQQFEEFFALLKEGQPWTPQEIDDLLWDRYGVTYDRVHLARILRADGMQYAKPGPMDSRQSPDAKADFRERLGETLTKDTDEKPLILGFFDASWPQPFENTQRMWSYDRTVEIDKPLVTVPWKTIGFYALLGKSTLIFRERTTKESICAALEALREQTMMAVTTQNLSNTGLTNSESSSSSFQHTRRCSMPSNPSGKASNGRFWQRYLRIKIILNGSLRIPFWTFRNASASPTTGSKRSSRIFKSYADHSRVAVRGTANSVKSS